MDYSPLREESARPWALSLTWWALHDEMDSIQAILEDNALGPRMDVDRPGNHRAVLTFPAGDRPDREWIGPVEQGSPLGQAMA